MKKNEIIKHLGIAGAPGSPLLFSGRLACREAAELIRTLSDERNAFEAQTNELLDALQSIRRYGLDTLSGRADGGVDDRQWQREAVNEMTRRARIAIEKAAGA